MKPSGPPLAEIALRPVATVLRGLGMLAITLPSLLIALLFAIDTASWLTSPIVAAAALGLTVLSVSSVVEPYPRGAFVAGATLVFCGGTLGLHMIERPRGSYGGIGIALLMALLIGVALLLALLESTAFRCERARLRRLADALIPSARVVVR